MNISQAALVSRRPFNFEMTRKMFLYVRDVCTLFYCGYVHTDSDISI